MHKQMSVRQKIRNAMREGGPSLLLRKSLRKIQRKMGSIPDTRHYFAHKMPRSLSSLNLNMELRTMNVTSEDIPIAKRIIAAYHQAQKDGAIHQKPGDEDAWDFAERTRQNNFLAALASADPERVANALSRIYQDGITYGISNAVDYGEAVLKGRLRNFEAALIKDRLVSLAELTNVLPFEGPEQGKFGANIRTDPARLVKEIGEAMGISIVPPDIDGGLFKLKLGDGYFDSRDVFSVYTAWRMSQLVPRKDASLCEIGAGIGKVALYANRLGYMDYSIFDIPQMNAVQAWYLIKALPELDVVLCGELARSKHSVKILPWWEFEHAKNKEYDLTLNEDSFPEISGDAVRDYLHQIKRTTKKYLLSINQEGGAVSVPGTEKRQLVVPKLIDESGGFRRAYRSPFVLRRGYAEELYEIL
jgi:hypothetical protein